MDTPNQFRERRIAYGLLILRLTLGLFLVQWSLEKLIVPDAAIRIARGFYGLALPAGAPMFLGIAELAVSLALCLGLYRQISYGIAFVIHTVTVIVSWRQLLDPYGLWKVGSHLWIAMLPVWGGFACLYLLRIWDEFSVDAWRSASDRNRLT